MRLVTVCSIVMMAAFAGGCSQPKPAGPPNGGTPDMRTMRLHIDGFQKSKSGAV
jgi:hypothetical protein